MKHETDTETLQEAQGTDQEQRQPAKSENARIEIPARAAYPGPMARFMQPRYTQNPLRT